MRMIYITTKKQFHPCNGRLFECICQFDDDFIEAHRAAALLCEKTGMSLSDLRFCQFDMSYFPPMILSYKADDIALPRLENDSVSEVGCSLLFPDRADRSAILWHDFYDMDVSEYENYITKTLEKTTGVDLF